MVLKERKKEGSRELTRIRGRRREHLLGDLKEMRGYWKLARTVWRTRFGRDYGTVLRQKTKCMNI